MVEILSGLDNGFPRLGTARMLCLENGWDTIPSPGALLRSAQDAVPSLGTRLRSGRDAVHAYGVPEMLCQALVHAYGVPGMLYMLTEWPGCCVSVMVSLPFGLT